MRYIVNDPEYGPELHETETDARHAFDRIVERLREEAGDGWHDDADSAFWGEVIPRQRLVLRVTARAEDNSEDGEWCREAGLDYLAEGVVEDVTAPDPTADRAQVRALGDRTRS
jgi:hypothetical protein